jgi:hypothetical protein
VKTTALAIPLVVLLLVLALSTVLGEALLERNIRSTTGAFELLRLQIEINEASMEITATEGVAK